MKTTHLFLLSGLITATATAQTPQHVNVGSLLDRVPKLPTTTQEALTIQKAAETNGRNADKYLSYADEMQALSDKIKDLNPISVRLKNGAIAIDAKFKADGVDKMNDEQKIAYARQQKLGGAGSDGRLAFAEQMKDPAFQKKFQAMSPQEKMAYMQQQGVMQAPAAVPQTSNPMQAEMVAMMQDPAMREKWKAMSPSERQVFIEERKKAKGCDASRKPATTQTAASGSFDSMLDDGPSKPAAAPSPANIALVKSKAFMDALVAVSSSIKTLVDQQKQQEEQAKANLQKVLQESAKTQISEGIAEAKRQGKSGQNWVLTNPALERQTRIAACQQRQRADNAALAATTAEWTKRLTALRQTSADYQLAMTAINYGESLFNDDSQFQNLATLSGHQASIFMALRDIDQSFGQLANQSAQTQTNLLDETKLTAGPRQLMQAGEG